MLVGKTIGRYQVEAMGDLLCPYVLPTTATNKLEKNITRSRVVESTGVVLTGTRNRSKKRPSTKLEKYKIKNSGNGCRGKF